MFRSSDMRIIRLSLSLIILCNIQLLSQTSLYMDGSPFDIHTESAICKEKAITSYIIEYLDFIGSSNHKGKQVNIFNKMRLHQDQCHQATRDTGVDRDKPFGMDVNDAIDIKTDKPLFINFAFGKCPPCLKEIPIINQIFEKHKNEYTFVVITPDKDFSKLRSRFHKGIKIITKSDMDITFQFLVNYYPATYITNKDQKIQWCLKEIESDFIGSFTYELIF